MSDLPKIFSVHVPKCGGSTLSRMFQLLYKGEFAHPKHNNNVDPDPKYHRCVHGHFNLASHIDRYLQNGFSFISFIREPSERALSHYCYWKTDPFWKSELCVRMNKEKWDFDTYVDNMIPDIAGRLIGGYYENLSYIGITEIWDISIDRIERQFGIKLKTVPKRRVSRMEKPELTNNHKLKIKQKSQVDYYMYKNAWNDMINWWENEDPKIAEELRCKMREII